MHALSNSTRQECSLEGAREPLCGLSAFVSRKSLMASEFGESTSQTPLDGECESRTQIRPPVWRVTSTLLLGLRC